MSLTRRLILAFVLLAGLSPAFAQAPPPVPALPDTERRQSYSISGTTCACAVNFQIYGDTTDVGNWIEVFLNGLPVLPTDPVFGWVLTSPTGPLATIPRPITDAVLTFNLSQTGTVQIVGARRPRRTSQFSENRGVAARDLNQALTDIIAQNRETWDKINDVSGRAVLGRPGETLNLLPILANRLNQGACFDSGGNLTTCVSVPSSTFAAGNGILFSGVGPTTITNNIAAGGGIAITGTNPLTIAASAGVNTNVLNTQTLPYTVANTDCGKTVNVAGGPGTLTLPAVGGFNSACVVQVCNTAANSNTNHALILSGFPSPSLPHLWMAQCEGVQIVNGAWKVSQFPGKFIPAFVPTCFADNGGSNTNDGLVSNSALNAVKDPQQCILTWQAEFDMSTGFQPTISPTGSQINPQTGSAGPLVLIGGVPKVINVTGNGGNAVLQNQNGGGNFVSQVQDFGGYFIYNNITLDCTNAGTHPCYGHFDHQQGGLDVNGGNVVFKGANAGDIGIFCDSICKINGNTLVTFAGSLNDGVSVAQGSVVVFSNGFATAANTTVANDIFLMNAGSSLTYSGPLTAGATTNVAEIFGLRGGSNACVSIGTVTGTFTGARQWSVLGNSVFSNLSATAVPGSAGINTLAGFAAGIIGSGTSGGC